MDPQNGTGANPGDSGAGSQGNPAGGNQGSNPASQGNPTNQGGTQTDSRDAELRQMQQEIRNLNAALAKRNQRNGNGEDENQLDLQTPEGQYGVALQLATGELRGRMEEIISLYPELSPEQVAMIRSNPWSFANLRTMQKCDWEQAAIEVETQMSKWAEAQGGGQGNQNGQGNPNPASVNGNPAPQGDEEPAAPGTEGDENPWTMPMDRLEKLKNKEVAKLAKQP